MTELAAGGNQTPPNFPGPHPSGAPVAGHADAALPPEPSMLESALWYARQGFNPIPQDRDKKPLVKWMQYQAKPVTESDVRHWWTRHPGANIAIVTGAVSNVVVVDIDGPEGIASLREFPELCDVSAPVSPPVVKTGRGFHAYFKHPGGTVKTVRLRDGLDIKGDGGLVTVPPSVHKSGTVYRFKSGHSLADVPLPELPPSLLEAIRDTEKPSTNGSTPPTGANDNAPALAPYAKSVLEREVGNVTAEDVGDRNAQLNKSAFALGQIVAAGDLPRDLVESKLFLAATRCGLAEEETQATIQSGIEAGMEQPREPAGQAALDWGVLQDLPPELPTVPALPPELIPAPLRSWIVDMAERASLPPEFFAAPALVALGTLLGRKVCICPKRNDDWIVAANLWGMVIARPSAKKSSAVKSAMKPLHNMVDEEQKKYDAATEEAKGCKVILETKLKGLKTRATKLASKGVAEDQAEIDVLNEQIITATKELDGGDVTEKRYITNGATIEKLGELLNENPNGILVLYDELYGFIRNLAKPDKAGDREAYLELWDGTGASTTTDRIGRGTIRINSPIVSLFGSMQPGKLSALVTSAVDGGVGDDGFLQRLQMAVWPDKLGAYKRCDSKPDKDAAARAFGVFKAFRDFAPMDVGATRDFGGGLSFMRFAPSAQDCFDKWLDDLERRLRSDDMSDCPAFESHLGKYRSLMPSLALIFHLVHVADGAAPGPVSLEATQMAIKWCAFLEAHARKIYAVELARGVNAVHLLAKKIKDGAVLDGMRVRDIYNAHWHGLKTSESVWLGLRELEALGWVQIATVRTTGGAPSHAVQLHPGLLKGANDGPSARTRSAV